MEQGYWLNVARSQMRYDGQFGYVHFCRIDCGDDYNKAMPVARDVAARFPAPEFKVSLSFWQHCGREVDIATGK